ncbi:MAG: exopolyphosphatase, partial [Polaromonas sp.]|nr:exopolyphosphatase [Polaromonas sp.]
DSLFIEQLMCLRLAVLLCHARLDPDLKGLQLSADESGGRSFALKCRSGWSAAFPQSAYLLNEEVLAWQKTMWTLTFQVA